MGYVVAFVAQSAASTALLEQSRNATITAGLVHFFAGIKRTSCARVPLLFASSQISKLWFLQIPRYHPRRRKNRARCDAGFSAHAQALPARSSQVNRHD